MEKISINDLVNEVISDLPREILIYVAQNLKFDTLEKDEIIEYFKNEVSHYSAKVQKKVINCTGTLLHTNLGRSQINTNYSGESTNIEFDLFNQKRGIRNEFLIEFMNLLLNSQDVCFVNNNASSLFITLKTLKDEFEINSVIISRGEIIEIGGSYRLPEIIQETGLNMIEIGTTNKTRLKDYQKALDKNDKSLILKVHRSNYSIEGFTEDVDIKELRSLADKNDALLLHDIGSGLVISRKFLKKENISIFDNEPTIQESLKDGADVVMFSGDKLFGSVQSGIIAGNQKIIKKIKDSPLFRTYRCSPFTLYELQETTKKYISKNELEIPLWKMISLKYDDLYKRVEEISKVIKFDHSIVDDYSIMGGGTMPNKKIDSPVLKFDIFNNEHLLDDLISNSTPIIPRTNKEKIVIDIRSTDRKNDEIIKNFFLSQ
ncbi:L-seryl-tRNA(Sec) selenium transferase [Acidimicrobiaceae bacterium]|nr:L-seryl-tRNA(Sec) selenium transferase [Acidimicrobiaceae bacterium]